MRASLAEAAQPVRAEPAWDPDHWILWAGGIWVCEHDLEKQMGSKEMKQTSIPDINLCIIKPYRLLFFFFLSE